MFDNPLYGSMGKSRSGKDQETSRKEQLGIPEVFAFPKSCESDSDRAPPVPTPRARSFTCSESKGQNPSPTPSNNSSSSNHSNNSSLQPQSFSKKPVVPSRSEGGVMISGKPPLPIKSRPGQTPELQSKPRDYRDSSELPGKMRPHARPCQPLPKDGMTHYAILVYFRHKRNIMKCLDKENGFVLGHKCIKWTFYMVKYITAMPVN